MWMRGNRSRCGRRFGGSRRDQNRSGRAFEALESRRLLATFVVDNASDAVDGDHSEGQLTLREAVALANATPDEDTTLFSSSIQSLIPISSIIPITAPLIIRSYDETGAYNPIRLLRVGDSYYRFFDIDDGRDSSLIGVTLERLTLDGSFSSGYEATYGGGVQSCENLTILDSLFDSCQLEGTVRFDGSSGATLTIRRTAFTDDSRGVKVSGGGDVVIDSCSFVNGGGVHATDVASMTIINTTIGNGSGISIGGASGSVSIANCTIAANTQEWGAGLYLQGGTTTLMSTIVTNNFGGDFGSASADIVVDGGTLDLETSNHNLVRNAATAGGLIHGEKGNLLGVDPRLGTVGDFGGPTQLYSLKPDSPALGAGLNPLGLTSDQRGAPFARESGPADIGAFEAQTLALVVDAADDIDDGLHGPGLLSLREALDAANGNPGADSITFDDSLMGATISPKRPLTISQAVTITGLGMTSLTIDGRDLIRLLETTGPATIADLRIANGRASQGGAIYATSALTLARVRLENNTATDSGGAIFARTSLPVTLSDCVFMGNYAATLGGALEALYAADELIIESCVFTSNESGGDGGAISTTGEVRASTFSLNTAVRDGGAVHGSPSLIDCELSQNTAGRDGGAVWAHVASITGCRLRENSAVQGGAVFSLRSFSEITGSVLSDNVASEQGGAVRSAGNLQITSSTMSVNQAGAGGAIYHDGYLAVVDSTLTGNSSNGEGGAVVVGGFEYLMVQGSTLQGNSAGTDGGAIFTNCRAYLENSIISNSHARRGGAIYSSNALTITRTTLSGNTAAGNGGGIYNAGTLGGTVSAATSTFAGNAAGLDGGGIWTNAKVAVANCTFSSNEAAGFGGGIAIDFDRSTITYATFADNRADSDGVGGGFGGGVSIGARSGNGSLRVEASIFAHNSRGADGAAPDEIDLTGSGSLDPTSSYNLVFDAASAGGMRDGVIGNVVGRDPVLGPLALNGGPTKTHALGPGSPALNAATPGSALPTDQRGAPRPYNTRSDIGAFEWLPTSFFSLSAHDDAIIRPADDADGSLRLLAWNLDGDLIVFRDTGSGWEATRPLDKVDAPAAGGNGVIWTDLADGLTRVGGASPEGFIVYTEGADGTWTYRNLSDELGVGAHTPVGGLTQFVSRTGLVVVFGLDAGGDMVAFQQSEPVGGVKTWQFVDISAQLDAQGMATPAITGITSYVTPWDAWNVVGLDAAGDIQAVWIRPSSFSQWRVDNLSDITGTLPLTGQLSVTQTTWRAINIGGTDEAGRVLVTWWLPSFGGDWRTNDLTTIAGAQPFAPGNLTGWVSPWGAINYAGLNSSNAVTAIWWTTTTGWRVSVLGSAGVAPERVLTSHQSPDGTMSILGAQSDDDVFQLWWRPDASGWTLIGLTDTATRV